MLKNSDYRVLYLNCKIRRSAISVCDFVIYILQVKSSNRKKQLDNAYLLQMFLGETRDLVSAIII